MGLLLFIINLYFVGKLNDAAMTAGLGLATFFVQALGYTVLMGTNIAQETLTSQAFGAGELYRCGALHNRGRTILLAVMIPIALVFFFSETIFLLIGQDPQVSRYAGQYACSQIVGALFFAQFDLTKRFLI